MNNPTVKHPLSYRPDIDGLRAVAVISVILFHIHADLLPGGFLGVDIFFVISGYLITGIIQRELAEQRFSLLNFYQRRAKRILPAFLFMLAACTAACVWLLTPDDFIAYLRSLRSSLLFGANLFFAQSGGYFDIQSAEKPLLHIWSLSVEEQFYFVFPLLIWLVHKYRPKYTVHAVIAMMAASLLSGLMEYKAEAYYLPQVRAYELLFGSLAAVFTTGKSANPSARTGLQHEIAACIAAVAALRLPVPAQRNFTRRRLHRTHRYLRCHRMADGLRQQQNQPCAGMETVCRRRPYFLSAVPVALAGTGPVALCLYGQRAARIRRHGVDGGRGIGFVDIVPLGGKPDTAQQETVGQGICGRDGGVFCAGVGGECRAVDV